MIVITHGYSKDHRPDLKQAVLELMVTFTGAENVPGAGEKAGAAAMAVARASPGIIDPKRTPRRTASIPAHRRAIVLPSPVD